MAKLRSKPGPKEAIIDWEQVKSMCAIQCTRDEIASCLGISDDTLQRAAKRDYNKLFIELRDEWAKGGHCVLRRKQWKLADNNAAMAIFLGKQMLGQKDDVRLNHSGTINQEIVHYGMGVPKKWSEEDEQQK